MCHATKAAAACAFACMVCIVYCRNVSLLHYRHAQLRMHGPSSFILSLHVCHAAKAAAAYGRLMIETLAMYLHVCCTHAHFKDGPIASSFILSLHVCHATKAAAAWQAYDQDTSCVLACMLYTCSVKDGPSSFIEFYFKQ